MLGISASKQINFKQIKLFNQTKLGKDKTVKFCTFLAGGSPNVGLKTDGGIINITALGFPSSMNEVIGGGEEMLANISDAAKDKALPALSEESLQFLPVTEPGKIICTGLNFREHAAETGKEVPDHPVFFTKFGDSLSAHGGAVALPPWLDTFDHEAELVIVAGKAAYNISREEAKSHIFGYTCGNDLSARRAQGATSQWLCGKALPGFAPVGPYVVTGDSFDPLEHHGIFCDLNGVRAQSGTTTDMIFDCYEIVSIASRYFPLSPGDLIFTGTPPGVIQGRKKEERKWLKPGDVVDITIDGIGTLTTNLV